MDSFENKIKKIKTTIDDIRGDIESMKIVKYFIFNQIIEKW
jgi:hypothetical protein